MVTTNQYLIRKLACDDFREVGTCLEAMASEFSKEIFIVPTIKYIQTIISGYGYTAGVFDKESLIGFASIVFPKLGNHNLGYLLNFNNQSLLSVVQLEHIYLHPEYRGKGIALDLLDHLLAELEPKYKLLISTISPQNISSLSLAFKLHQRIIAFSKVYDVKRFIMLCELPNFQVYKKEEPTIELPTDEIDKIVNLLNLGYEGISFGSNKSTIKFLQGRKNLEKISNQY